MRVLITGGAGFVGSTMTKHFLAAGWDVNVLDELWFDPGVPDLFRDNPRYRFIRGSILDPAALKKSLESVDFVVHAAAVVGEPASKKFPDLTQKVNYEGSRQLIQSLAGSPVKGMVFLSTCSNYGIADGVANENTALMPLSVYSDTKIKIERYLMDEAKQVNWVICRLSTVYGMSPRMRFDLTVNDFTANAFRDGALSIFLPHTFRPYIHVQDVARVIGAIIRDFDRVKNNVFNVGFSGENYQKIKIAEIVKQLLPGLKLDIVTTGTDTRDYQVDFSKLQQTLDVPRRWDVRSGAQEILEVLRRGEIADSQAAKYYNTNPVLSPA
ncbi:MAG: NAD(P)-dependent oxidoreductase [Candidatus Omnitrophica bacterium]|nr:NAD(P)-dependent oxidoreductase [Candidatus Omnitrophota bacterium]